MTGRYLEDFAVGQTFRTPLRSPCASWLRASFKPAGGIVGASSDELRWPGPVQGVVKVRTTTLN